MIFDSVEAKIQCDFNFIFKTFSRLTAKFPVKNYIILNPKVGRALNPPIREITKTATPMDPCHKTVMTCLKSEVK